MGSGGNEKVVEMIVGGIIGLFDDAAKLIIGLVIGISLLLLAVIGLVGYICLR